MLVEVFRKTLHGLAKTGQKYIQAGRIRVIGCDASNKRLQPVPQERIQGGADLRHWQRR